MTKRNKYRHSRAYLEKKGFDGFCNEEISCGCDLDDFEPCQFDFYPEGWADANCKPGFKHKDGLMYAEKEKLCQHYRI